MPQVSVLLRLEDTVSLESSSPLALPILPPPPHGSLGPEGSSVMKATHVDLSAPGSSTLYAFSIVGFCVTFLLRKSYI